MPKHQRIDPVTRLASTLVKRQGETFPPEDIEKKIRQCNEEFHLLIKANELRNAVLHHELCSTDQGLELVFTLRRSRQSILLLDSHRGSQDDPFFHELELVLQRCKSLPNDYRRALTTSEDPSKSTDIQRLRRHASARHQTGLLEQLSSDTIQTAQLQRLPRTLPNADAGIASFIVTRIERNMFYAKIVGHASHQQGGSYKNSLHKPVRIKRLGLAATVECGPILAFSLDTNTPLQATLFVEFDWVSRVPSRYSVSEIPTKTVPVDP